MIHLCEKNAGDCSHVGEAHIWREHSSVEGTFTCRKCAGDYSHVKLMCGGDINVFEKHAGAIHMWWKLVEGTSDQCEILHSLIFFDLV